MQLFIQQGSTNSWEICRADDNDELVPLLTIMRADGNDMETELDELIADQMCSGLGRSMTAELEDYLNSIA